MSETTTPVSPEQATAQETAWQRRRFDAHNSANGIRLRGDEAVAAWEKWQRDNARATDTTPPAP